MSSLQVFADAVRAAMDNALPLLEETTFLPAAQLIWDAQAQGNRLHITGIGKPAHVAAYMASLFSSTGTPTYFLHGTEAVHGSCGQLTAGDVVICISNSGETAELKATAIAVRNNGCKVIAVTGNPESWLAKFADEHLCAAVTDEGGPLNRAPRASILVETLVLQGLSVLLQERRAITPQEYVQRHPGGSLGQLRDHEK
ncbi:MAG: SIS domain-containing protein [Clostridia bacterium]|nr:SIS domain-containing protein [Clostridia bacterium]